MKGTIKKLVSERGFGFITGEDGKDVFFHKNSLEGGADFDSLQEGTPVEYDTEQGPKGPSAINVKVTTE